MKYRLLPLMLAALLAGATAQAADVLVFAAASLSDALQDIRAQYEPGTADRVNFNFAASSALARQIDAGAPADLFFSADEEKMDQLQAKKLIVESTRASVLSNALVLVTPRDDARLSRPEDLLKPECERLALASPEAVPAGIYAKAFLRSRGWWEAVEDKVIPTENVRAALAAVESANADAAFVYRTDARASGKVRVAYEVPAAEAPSITYPIALVAGTRNEAAAKRFLRHLRGPEAGAVFTRHGFTVLPATAP